MARHNILGKLGEEYARNYLTAQGYAIADSNVRIGTYEIDIIAIKGSRISFIEVKTRSEGGGDPLDAVDANRIRRMARAADIYIRSHAIDHDPQFDIIAITGSSPSDFKLTHYEDAFMPPLTGGR